METIEPKNKLEYIDMPPEASKELDRLHYLLTGAITTKETQEWARGRIEQIHGLLFCGAIFVHAPENPQETKAP
jgi:hypothetical protein